MNKTGPIVVIEDDEDDRELLESVFKELNVPNEILFFKNGELALNYLTDITAFPFIIISDINLPKLNGFELRKMVQTNEGISEKCIPYLFLSTAIQRKTVVDAYMMSAQGIFQKPTSDKDVKNTIRVIIEYWQQCCAPNDYEK